MEKQNEQKIEFTTRIPKQICPECGYESPPGGTIAIQIEPYKANYCIACWGKWIYEHIPMMVLKSEYENQNNS